MDDILLKLWPYFEKAGLVSGVIMSVWLYFTLRDLKELRNKFETVQEQRIKDALAVAAVIEKNTAATKETGDLFQNFLFANRKGGLG